MEDAREAHQQENEVNKNYFRLSEKKEEKKIAARTFSIHIRVYCFDLFSVGCASDSSHLALNSGSLVESG